MKKRFDIQLGGISVGTAWVSKTGLYYHISCDCNLTGEVRYKIIATGTDGACDLGLCVPKGNNFGLEIRLPIKRLGTGELKFKAVPKHQPVSGMFIPLSPDEPFRYIQMLKNSFLTEKEGKRGIMLPCQNANSNPTGQWSDPNTSE